MALVDDIRTACARVAARARHVRVEEAAIEAYAAALHPAAAPTAPDPATHATGGDAEARAAATLTLDAINFGSGWFPTLRKRDGRSGYFTVAMGIRDRFTEQGPWLAEELATMEAAELARWLRQDPGHELMALFATALRELGARVAADHDGSYLALAQAHRSAVAFAEDLATWPTWHDVSRHDGERVPFFKRAQIAAADLVQAGVAGYADLHRLTLFADNLVPHVLRLDGVLRFDDALAARIEREELLEHGSPEEVEIRACAVHAVELIAAARGDATPQQLDFLLWNRGQEPRYKARPRHRSRTTAY